MLYSQRLDGDALIPWIQFDHMGVEAGIRVVVEKWKTREGTIFLGMPAHRNVAHPLAVVW